MSHSAREWVWEKSTTRGTARLVLLALAERVGESCVAFGSTRALAARTNASERAVSDAIKATIRLGELELVEGRRGPYGARVYRLPDAVGWVPGAAVEGGADSAAPANGGCENCTLGGAGSSGEGCSSCGGGVADSAPQNQKNESGTGRKQRGARERVGSAAVDGAAAISLPSDWTPDDELIGWAAVSGHLQRLGPDGLDHATAKWHAHRATAPARTAGQWRADWQQWISRERPTGRPPLRTVAGDASRAPQAADRNAALLQAALADLQARGGAR
ncbi:helix-turn-helix domain-containing protein [Kitasatospora sp. NBC_01300]|uniref:helix-turn-helix domain-containing protein n=1 Tax=Kitasatospora sp. NBC_01300 TaxID=2903574 RepID=UPI00352C8A1A|nr:helix-turn-helix domain-containing protein [Kitasatospora sp. NBC_01300]